jgi:HlyD family secretion protein
MSRHALALQPLPLEPLIIDGKVIQEPSIRRLVMAGFALLFISVGSFLSWGLFASLDRAAIAVGSIVVDGNKKTVQHLEGGILKDLLVKEGDMVQTGQVLMRLDATQLESGMAQLTNEHLGRLARIARLQAEQSGSRKIVFPPEVINAQHDASVAATMASQISLLNAHWASYDGEINVRMKKIDEVASETSAARSQIAANQKVLAITQREADTLEGLYKKGLALLPKLQELQRNVAETEGRIGELTANIARNEQTIAGLKVEIVNLESTRQNQYADELQQVLSEDADYAGKMRGANDMLSRLEVRAPQSGKVVNLQIFTKGGVIEAGKPILDIVPQNEGMLAEVKVNPTDIDSVHAGLPAEVRLTAYKQRKVPAVPGIVTEVSADKQTDPRNGAEYYTAQVKIDLSTLPADLKVSLYPGMPTEVMIATGERRAIDYFISPFTETWHRAFRED